MAVKPRGNASMNEVAGFSLASDDGPLRIRKAAAFSIGGLTAIVLTGGLLLSAALVAVEIVQALLQRTQAPGLLCLVLGVLLLASVPACWGVLVWLEAVGFAEYEAKPIGEGRTRCTRKLCGLPVRRQILCGALSAKSLVYKARWGTAFVVYLVDEHGRRARMNYWTEFSSRAAAKRAAAAIAGGIERWIRAHRS